MEDIDTKIKLDDAEEYEDNDDGASILSETEKEDRDDNSVVSENTENVEEDDEVFSETAYSSGADDPYSSD